VVAGQPRPITAAAAMLARRFRGLRFETAGPTASGTFAPSRLGRLSVSCARDTRRLFDRFQGSLIR
jgi:hypothetical protein